MNTFFNLFEDLEKEFLLEEIETTGIDRNINIKKSEHRNNVRDVEAFKVKLEKTKSLIPTEKIPLEKLKLIQQNAKLKLKQAEAKKGKSFDSLRDLSDRKRMETSVSESFNENYSIPKDLRREKKVFKNLSFSKIKNPTLEKEIAGQSERKKAEALLFNGYSGDALKFFIKNEINRNNFEEMDISKKMKEDSIVKRIISNIKGELRRLHPDQNRVKALKLQFRNMFTYYRKKEE